MNFCPSDNYWRSIIIRSSWYWRSSFGRIIGCIVFCCLFDMLISVCCRFFWEIVTKSFFQAHQIRMATHRWRSLICSVTYLAKYVFFFNPSMHTYSYRIDHAVTYALIRTVHKSSITLVSELYSSVDTFFCEMWQHLCDASPQLVAFLRVFATRRKGWYLISISWWVGEGVDEDIQFTGVSRIFRSRGSPVVQLEKTGVAKQENFTARRGAQAVLEMVGIVTPPPPTLFPTYRTILISMNERCYR